jgi:aspartate racemase
VVPPDPEAQVYIHDKYIGELINGIFIPETRDGLLAIVERMKVRDGIEGLILGGTELPLILRADEYAGVLFLDTTKLHADAIVSRLLLERVRTACARCRVAESVPFFTSQYPERRVSVIRPPEWR